MITQYENNRLAVKVAKESANYGEEAESGGFDIMRKLFIKQHKEQQKKDKKD